MLSADVEDALSFICLPQNADSFFRGVALAFHFLGPFYKVPDYHSRRTRFSRLNQAERFAQPGPVVIGGLGGSGTRVYAALAQHAGFYLGGQLNVSLDNLWVTLLLKRQYRMLDSAQRVARRGHDHRGGGRGSWNWDKALRLARAQPPQPGAYRGWGFKEPNTHVFLEHLAARFEGLRYLYVLRHGLDMAWSDNVAQLHNWGARYGVQPPHDEGALPSAQLEFWLRATETGKRLLGDRFLVLRYDELTASPASQLSVLADWLGVDASCFDAPEVAAWVEPTDSQGRYRERGAAGFSAAQLDGVRALGFEVAV